MAQLEKFKLSAVLWDSDKDPRQFFVWLENFGSLVRATEHGNVLEDMLDSKLRRAKVNRQAVPSFLLEDPDFAPRPLEAAASQEATTGDSTSGSTGGAAGSAASGHFSLGRHSIAYDDLPDEAKSLDAMLYNVLRMNIRGSKQALLSVVTFPSYVQGVCVLVKHMGISRMQRMMTAFSELDRLAFTGNVMEFQTQFLALKRELDNCKATIVHYTVCRLMRAFDGKSKTIQFKIAEDFNKMDLDDPDINLYDMVQQYCSELAAVDSPEPHRVMQVAEDKCGFCSRKGHNIQNCKKLTKKTRKEVKKQMKQGKRPIVCFGCGEVGHVKTECPKEQDSSSSSSEDEQQQEVAPGKEAPTDSADSVLSAHLTDTSSLSAEQIGKVLAIIRRV